jgi:hypothetical protein
MDRSSASSSLPEPSRTPGSASSFTRKSRQRSAI